MKSNSNKFSRKATVALLFCTSLAASHPLAMWAEGSVTIVQALYQQITVKGMVKDAMGPVIGASVVEKGNSGNGTITDMNGNFSLSVKQGATLIVTYIGYKAEEIKAVTGEIMNIVLKEDSEMLDEVVVVGYGTMRKKDITGSVVQIKPSTLANEAPKSVQDVLRGVPGLKVGMETSAKGGGTLEIRGDRSMSDISKDSPMIILDDMPFYGELSEINPENIGQIDVLKDASAAAVYGAQAANGVIIITSKKGKKGKPVINFSAKVGFVTKSAYRDVYGADGWLKFREDWLKTATYGVNPETGNYEAYQTGTIKPGYYDRPDRLPAGVSLDDWRAYTSNADGQTDLGIYADRIMPQTDQLLRDNFLAGRTFDWYKHAFQTGINQDYNASVSGAGEQMNYYLSFGYLHNEGAVRGNEYRAVRANMKLSANITDWLEIGGNVNFQDRSDGDKQLDVNSMLSNSPFASYRDADGNLEVHPMGTKNSYNMGYNYDFNRQYEELEKGYTVLNSIFTTKLKFPFNITYSFNASPRFEWFYDRWFQSSEHPDWDAVSHGANRKSHKKFDWSINNTINWDYTFARKHHFILTLVQEAEKHQSWEDNIEARNFSPSDVLGFHKVDVASKIDSKFYSYDTYQTGIGMLARLFYSLDDRYMLTVSVRRDGYSAFGEDKPFATFPSVALAWNFANEKFFKWNAMSTGKLRGSWGLNGNRTLTDPYLALATLAKGSGLYGYLDGSGNLREVEYLKIDRMANPKLKWEKSEAWNFAVDFGFLNDRISGSLETYIIYTRDMILNRSLPPFTGFNSIATNLGEVQNSGFELTINTLNIKNENFEWSTGFNITYNKNKINHIYYDYENVLDANGNVIGQKEKDEYGKWFVGKNIATIWDYRVIGIWQPDELEEARKVGQLPGDPKVENVYTEDDKINEDGSRTPVYNDKDKVFQGQTTSPVIWSMRNNFTLWKNFDFSFNIYSCLGSKMKDTSYLNQEGTSEVDYGLNKTKKEYWTPENRSNTYARLNSKGPTGITSPARYINRSFVRLENVSLGYTFPKLFTAKWGIGGLKVYGSIRNVAVWSKSHWKLGDIETNGLATRTYSLGLNIIL